MKTFNIKIGKGFCRAIMREILRQRGVQWGEVDRICKMIPEEYNLHKIIAHRQTKKLPDELLEEVEKYKDSFYLGQQIESIVWKYKNEM